MKDSPVPVADMGAVTVETRPEDQSNFTAAMKSLEFDAVSVSTQAVLKPTNGGAPLSNQTSIVDTVEHHFPIPKESLQLTSIESLPNEILSQVFGFLDISPPSASHEDLIDEPRFTLTYAENANFKAASCVSKRWREAILPKLFRHARFVVGKPRSMMPPRNLETEIQPFLNFVGNNTLLQTITTFVLVIGDRTITGDENVPRHKLDLFAQFWRSLFASIDPTDLLIIAHPQFLGALTSCHVYAADNWNFDCPCHYLRLRRPVSPPEDLNVNDKELLSQVHPEKSHVDETDEPATNSSPQDSVHQADAASPLIIHTPEASASTGVPTDSTSESSSSVTYEPEAGRVPHAQASVLFSTKSWSSILLNEGSFIKAYSTYEFWLRQAPSILSNMVGADNQPYGALLSPTIREMDYIGIFPMASHFAGLTRHLPRLDRLYVQLVPRNEILENKSKLVQVEMQDLWMERNSCYALLMRELFNAPPMRNYKYLQVFESGDAADTDAWHMAVEYVKRAGNGWRVAADGVFERNSEDLAPEPEEGADVEDPSLFQGALIRWAWNGITKLPVSAYPLYDNPMGPGLHIRGLRLCYDTRAMHLKEYLEAFG